MRSNGSPKKTVRRSVALPTSLVKQAKGVAPQHLKSNFNRLVIVALEQFVAQRQHQEFAEAVAEMAHDPQVQQESLSITTDFRDAENDGLPSERR